MFSKRFAAAILGCLALCTTAQEAAPTYDVSVDSISVTDQATGIADIEAIHNGRPFDVVATLAWADQIFDETSSNLLLWEMSVGGKIEETGSIDLSAVCI